MHAAEYIRGLNKLVTGGRRRLACLALPSEQGRFAVLASSSRFCWAMRLSNRQTHTDAIAVRSDERFAKTLHGCFWSPSVLRASPVETKICASD